MSKIMCIMCVARPPEPQVSNVISYDMFRLAMKYRPLWVTQEPEDSGALRLHRS